ncbi:hypothetical protein MOD11_18895, partial [Bacillus atrophaeus]|uniref:hypothetical protein n=1 Tax=Bacillus atrophaeus TaxID=1452 RepID=UPI00227EA2E1
ALPAELRNHGMYVLLGMLVVLLTSSIICANVLSVNIFFIKTLSSLALLSFHTYNYFNFQINRGG